MKGHHLLRRQAVIAGLLLFLNISKTNGAATPDAKRVLSRAGLTRGICVVLDDRDCGLSISLAKASELIIFNQLTDDDALSVARKKADGQGLYGTRIYVERGDLREIQLGDNLADTLVASGDAGTVSEEEVLRVLCPEGKAFLGDKVLTKPLPDGTDDWSHPYHGPDNNPRSRDKLARAPYLTQFLAEPWYCPQPEVTVAAGGRIFKAFGNIAFKRREWPWMNALIAMNGHNGTLLWKRSLKPDFWIHRNTLIATPETVYLGDDTSCRLLEARTGKLKGEIAPPVGVAGGTVWNWMALQDGILYAMMGKDDWKYKGIRTHTAIRVWSWRPIPNGYRDALERKTFGFGRSILAIDPKTKKVLWRRHERDLIDGRAVCMSNRRLFYLCRGKRLVCLDVKTGKALWENTDAGLLLEIGATGRPNHFSTGYASDSYMKCTDRAVYFCSPTQARLVAVSAEDGKKLWSHPHGNYHLIIRDDALYAIGIGKSRKKAHSKKFDLLTGQVLEEIKIARQGCARATASMDGIFIRGNGRSTEDGSLRYCLPEGGTQRIRAVRPACNDGVVVANGLLYFGPWMCSCNQYLLGVAALRHAGDVQLDAKAGNQRVERKTGNIAAPFEVSPEDWPTYRADNARTAGTSVAVPGNLGVLWKYASASKAELTAPVAAGGMVFVGGFDGIVRGLDAASGKEIWKTYTGGRIFFPPTIWNGRAFVGSADGYMYVFAARTGKLLWRFRGAPMLQRIPVYGTLSTCWPVASGVMVSDGVAYFAAGMTEYHLSHLFAVDAATGELKWQTVTGAVGVQGHLLGHVSDLYLAGGSGRSPARFSAKDGRLDERFRGKGSRGARGSRGKDIQMVPLAVGSKGGESSRVRQEVRSTMGRMLYDPGDHRPFDENLMVASDDRLFIYSARSGLTAFKKGTGLSFYKDRIKWTSQPKLWEIETFEKKAGIALTGNAVIAIGSELDKDSREERHGIRMLSVKDGKVMWEAVLPSEPVHWGIAVDRAGRIVVSLMDGRVVCFGKTGTR